MLGAMDNRNQVLFGGVVAVITIGILIVAAFFMTGQRASAPAEDPGTPTEAISATDHVRGNASSTVTLIEYGDFECPACGAYEPLIEQLEQEYEGKILFAFRNFPLTELHKNAMQGAQAAEAAGLQGKYWEMHDLLFKNQSDWGEATIAKAGELIDSYAKSLNLDLDKFHADMKSQAVADKIKADKALGTVAKLDHTPTFFINLKEIANPQDYAAFKSAVDAALAGS